jgi:hypothetical protein
LDVDRYLGALTTIVSGTAGPHQRDVRGALDEWQSMRISAIRVQESETRTRRRLGNTSKKLLAAPAACLDIEERLLDFALQKSHPVISGYRKAKIARVGQAQKVSAIRATPYSVAARFYIYVMSPLHFDGTKCHCPASASNRVN